MDISKNKSHSVFISYSHKDIDIAKRIIELLKKNNYRIKDLNVVTFESIYRTIIKQIEASDFILILLSRDYLKSRFAEKELKIIEEEMNKRNVTVIPILIDDSEIPFLLKNVYSLKNGKNLEKNLMDFIKYIDQTSNIEFSKLDFKKFDLLVKEILVKKGFKIIDHFDGPYDPGYDFIMEYKFQDPFKKWIKEIWIVTEYLYRNKRANLQTLQNQAFYLTENHEISKSLIITTNQFTSVALDWLSKSSFKNRISIIDGPELRKIIQSYPVLIKKYFGGK